MIRMFSGGWRRVTGCGCIWAGSAFSAASGFVCE